jgi:hypothetical protein
MSLVFGTKSRVYCPSEIEAMYIATRQITYMSYAYNTI